MTKSGKIPTPEALAKAEEIVRRYIFSSFPELAHIDVRELPLIDSIALALTEQAREIEQLKEDVADANRHITRVSRGNC